MSVGKVNVESGGGDQSSRVGEQHDLRAGGPARFDQEYVQSEGKVVDFDIRMNSNAHSAGLKRLSARAHAGGTPPSSGGRRVFFSFAAYARTAIDHLRNCQVPIEKGLSDEEFARVEETYGFTFPPDLRAILHEGLPVGEGFPNWRHGSSQQLQMRFDLPAAGLLYEVARSNMWWKQWGPRPVDVERAVRVARAALRKAPVLVPVYSHCYIPSSPNLVGNPVFFVYLKDVFVSGIDIADFFQRDQFTPHDYEPPTNLPDFMEWVEETSGSRVSRQDFLKERTRLMYGKEILIIIASGAGDGDSGVNSSLQDAQHQQETVAPASRKSDVNTEEGEKKWDVLDRDRDRHFDPWGRSLDTVVAKHSEVLFKSLDNFGRRPNWKSLEFNNNSKSQQQQQGRSDVSRAVTASGHTVGKNPSHQDRVSKFSYFKEMSLSSKTLMHFSINAPPWAARAARRIEFWSELMEKQPTTNVLATETLFSAHNVDCDVAKYSKACWKCEDTTSPKEPGTKFDSRFLPKWVVRYLDEISLRLRNGGWNEDDIEEIMETSTPPRKLLKMDDKQSVLDSLSRQAEILSSSLREAGWSIMDVAEVLNMDLSFGDHSLGPTQLSQELAVRFTTFAECVVNA